MPSAMSAGAMGRLSGVASYCAAKCAGLWRALGLRLTGQRDILLFLVEEHMSRSVLEGIATAGAFEEKSGTGIAFQIAIEDAVGLSHQIAEIKHEIEDQI